MKKIFLLTGIMLLCFAGTAQTTNSKGILKKNVLQLNNGITFAKGDTIMLGEPQNNANEFTYIYEPKHGFGLLGGNGADKKNSYKMFIIHFFTTKTDKENSEKQVIASLGYGKDEVILDCEIAEAVDYGEVIAKGRIPQKFNIAVKRDETKQKTVEQQPTIIAEKTAEIQEKTTIKLTENTLLNKINELQNNKYLTDNEHYQLLKLVTGNNANIDGKKELIKKLQTLRDDNKLTLEEYDKIVDLML
ncbi:MAG: hypothetical protein LBT27_08595 [Prevotellaceae bacterium]|jgi:hypothetical protein|nr:hypothetical protein [Prevotellaceae bacterium]